MRTCLHVLGAFLGSLLLGLYSAAAMAQDAFPGVAVEMENGDRFRGRLLQDSLLLRTEYASLRIPTTLVGSLTALDSAGLVEVVLAGEDTHAGYLLSTTLSFEIVGGARIDADGVRHIEFDNEPVPTPDGAVWIAMRSGDAFWAVPAVPSLTVQTAYGPLSFEYANIAVATLQTNGDIEVLLKDDIGQFSGVLLDETLEVALRSEERIPLLLWNVRSLGSARDTTVASDRQSQQRTSQGDTAIAAFVPPESVFDVAAAGLGVILAMEPGAYSVVVDTDRDPFVTLYHADQGERGELLESNDDGGPGNSSRIDFCVPVPADYELFIEDVNAVPATARVTLESFETLPVAVGRTVLREIASDRGSWVIIEITAPGGYVVDVMAQTDDLDPVVELFGPAQSLGRDDDGGDGLNSRLSVSLPTGSYCLHLRDYDGDSGNAQITVRHP